MNNIARHKEHRTRREKIGWMLVMPYARSLSRSTIPSGSTQPGDQRRDALRLKRSVP